MLNPNIHKRIRVLAGPVEKSKFGSQYQYVAYKGQILEVNERFDGFLKPGNRYAYLKYSIMTDSYYVTAK